MNYIEFIGNSWPKGHSISQLYINSRIDPQKVVRFSISIKTEDYYAEDESYFEEVEEFDEKQSNWEAKLVWYKNQRCINVYTSSNIKGKPVSFSNS